MNELVWIVAIVALFGVVVVISMCVLADRLSRRPDTTVTIVDTGRAIGAIVGAAFDAVGTAIRSPFMSNRELEQAAGPRAVQGGSDGPRMSGGPPTVKAMNAPSQPGSPEHWAAWLDRYGDDYATHDERRAAYQDFQTNLTIMQAVFSQPDDMHTAGYLAAHERVADGDADSPDDAELWVPPHLSGPARADWLEGFRSHFEP